MRKLALLAGAVIAVAGCATVSEMTATSGSRADGIVKLSFEYGILDKVQIDQVGALKTAKQRCATWGYTGAEPFGGVTRQCQAMGTYGCMRWFATVEYQCTSGPIDAPVANVSTIEPIQTAAAVTASVGPRKVRAKTASGYCLDVPDDYVGSGSASKPSITSAMPRCSALGAD